LVRASAGEQAELSVTHFRATASDRMQFSIKNLLLFTAGAAVGIVLTKAAASFYGSNTPLLVASLIGGMASWGLGFGSLLSCPWRGCLIGTLSAAITIFLSLATDEFWSSVVRA
jgi:hypothetical protein